MKNFMEVDVYTYIQVYHILYTIYMISCQKTYKNFDERSLTAFEKN